MKPAKPKPPEKITLAQARRDLRALVRRVAEGSPEPSDVSTLAVLAVRDLANDRKLGLDGRIATTAIFRLVAETSRAGLE